MRPEILVVGPLALGLGLAVPRHAAAASAVSADYSMAAQAVLPGAAFGARSVSYAMEATIEMARGTWASSVNYLQHTGFTPALARVETVIVDPPAVAEATFHSVAMELILDDGTSFPALGNAVVEALAAPITAVGPELDHLGIGPVIRETFGELTLATEDGPRVARVRVLDTLPDNFGSYAGDGLPDAWQGQYFGEENPAAGPLRDPDGDAQDNRFEYIAGLNPTNALSRLVVSIEPPEGDGGEVRLRLGPAVAGRRYRVEQSAQVTARSWGLVGEREPVGLVGNEILTFAIPAREAHLFLRVRVERIR